MNKRMATVAMATTMLGSSVAGVALFTPSPAGAQDDVETPSDAIDPTGRLADALAPLIEDGTLTQAQVEAVVDALAEARPERPFGGHLGHRLPGSSDVLTDVLGIDDDMLRDALIDGQNLAEIAEANGVDPQTVVDTLVAEHQTRLDEAVADGRIDAADAADKAADAAERVEAMVNGELPADGPAFGPRRFGRFGPPTDDAGSVEGTTF